MVAEAQSTYHVGGQTNGPNPTNSAKYDFNSKVEASAGHELFSKKLTYKVRPFSYLISNIEYFLI